MNVHISKQRIVCFILFMPVFQPIFLDYITMSIHFYGLMLYIIVGYVIFFMIKKRRKPSNVTIIILLLESWILLSTILGGGNYDEAIKSLLRIGVLFLLLDVYKNRFEVLIDTLMLHAELCVYLNLITLIITPNGLFSRSNSAYGMTHEWFLGADNYFAMWLFPAVVVAWIYGSYYKKNTRMVIISIAALSTEFIQGSVTGIIGVGVFLLLMLIPFLKRILTPIRSVGLAISIFWIIVVLRDTNIFKPILLQFGEDLTFSGRLTIWDNAIRCINQKPIMGYGILTNNTMVGYLGQSSSGTWAGATHCHSQFLQIAFQGGLVAIILFGLIIFIEIYKCMKVWPDKIAQIAGYAISLYILMGVTEVFSFPTMYLIFPLANLLMDIKMKNKKYKLYVETI